MNQNWAATVVYDLRAEMNLNRLKTNWKRLEMNQNQTVTAVYNLRAEMNLF